MVRKKKLNPSGSKGQDGKFHNAHLSLNEDELEAAGLEIGEEVLVRVREDVIVVQKAGKWPNRKSLKVNSITPEDAK
ncbi:MAG: hypothetical protein R6U17_00670 [Thermoplasmata archaeon]